MLQFSSWFSVVVVQLMAYLSTNALSTTHFREILSNMEIHSFILLKVPIVLDILDKIHHWIVGRVLFTTTNIT
jgi:hypothetical protein